MQQRKQRFIRWMLFALAALLPVIVLAQTLVLDGSHVVEEELTREGRILLFISKYGWNGNGNIFIDCDTVVKAGDTIRVKVIDWDSERTDFFGLLLCTTEANTPFDTWDVKGFSTKDTYKDGMTPDGAANKAYMEITLPNTTCAESNYDPAKSYKVVDLYASCSAWLTIVLEEVTPTPAVPKTGDNTPLLLMAGLMAFGAAGLGAMQVLKRRSSR